MPFYEPSKTGAIVSTKPLSSAPVPAINSAIPLALVDRMLFLTDSSLKNGLHLVAGPGSGKSRWLGRILAWQMLIRGKPQVILDPSGGGGDNLLDKVSRLPLNYRKKFWPRLVYVDAGATDFITPTPLYYRISKNDTLFEIANRPLGLFKRQDPQLESAPILGWNSVYECGIFAGQIAAALDRQIDFVADLVKNPRNYKEDLKQVVSVNPELQAAVSYFREMMDPTSGDLRNRRTSSFLAKLLPLLADPPMLATFAASTRRIDWEAVIAKGQTVLIDFRHERDPDRRRFKLLYWFRDFIDYVKYRGMAGRGQEVMFLIDEVTQLLGHRSLNGSSIMAEDLEELVAVLGRNFGVNVVISHQNLSQVDERIRNVLMQMGTQMIGVISNPDDAMTLAQQFFHYDPYWVRKEVPVWMSGIQQDYVIDYTTVEFTSDEQLLLLAQRFQRLKRFQFYIRPAAGEGDISGKLKRISIANLDYNQYPDEAEIAPLRHMLTQRDGIPIDQLLAEVRNCSRVETVQNPAKPSRSSAILNSKFDDTDDSTAELDTISTDQNSVTLGATVPSSDIKRADHEEFWR